MQMSVRPILTCTWYFLISVTMIIVNSFTIYVIAKTRRLRQQACNVFFLNLALADILVGLDVGVAVSIFLFQFPLGENDIACKIERIAYLSFLQASVFFTLAISFDRFAFIRWPFLYRKHVTPKASWRLVGFVWFLSLLEGGSICFSPTFYQEYSCQEFYTSNWVHVIGHIVFLSIAVCFLLSVYFYFSLLGIVRHQRRKHSSLSRTFETELSTLAKHPVGSLKTVGSVHENPDDDYEVQQKIHDSDNIMDAGLDGSRAKVEGAEKEEDRCQKCFSGIYDVQKPGASPCKNVDVVVVSHLNLRQQSCKLEETFDTTIKTTNDTSFRSENHEDYGVPKSQAAQLRKDQDSNDDGADIVAVSHCTCAVHDVVRNSRSPFNPEDAASFCSNFPGEAHKPEIFYSLPNSRNKRAKRNPALSQFKVDVQLPTFTNALGNATTIDNAQSRSVINEINAEHGATNKHLDLVIDSTFEVVVTFRQVTQSERPDKECMDTEDICLNNPIISSLSMAPANTRSFYTTRESLNSAWSVSSQCIHRVSANSGWKAARNKEYYFHNPCFHSKPSSCQGCASTIQTIFNSSDSEMGATSLQRMRCCLRSFDHIRDERLFTFVSGPDDETRSERSNSRCSCSHSQRKKSGDNNVSATITNSLGERRSTEGDHDAAKIHHQCDKRKATRTVRTQKLSKDIRVARRLFVMFGVFVVCWMPCIIIHFATYGLRLPGFIDHSIVLIGLSNSVFNFFVYPLRTRTFRNAMRKVMPICKKLIASNWEN